MSLAHEQATLEEKKKLQFVERLFCKLREPAQLRAALQT